MSDAPPDPERFDPSALTRLVGEDPALHAMLIGEFLANARECLDGLLASHTSDSPDEWRRAAHAFKGICYNLGAQRLGDLCRVAQDRFQAEMQEKSHLLEKIRAEMDYLENLLAA